MTDNRTILLDVSRLMWRRWAGRQPTGIDRVCLAWLARFADRSRAVLQWRGRVRVLSATRSARLFALLRQDGPGFRARFGAMLPVIAARRLGRGDLAGRLYLNVGHTGLNHDGLSRWIAAQRVRAVFMVHDLIPITHPGYCRPGEAARHGRRICNALHAASGIIANSAATRDELARFAIAGALPLPPVLAAWLGCPDVPPVPAPPGLARPWFVTVGTIEGRKNHLLLLHVWHRLAQIMGDTTPLLVVAGQRGWQAGPALAMLDRDPSIARHVVELRGADDAGVAGLIAGAQALLMPSFAEGFGLPVVEALRLSTPVIASDLPVFREIAGAIPLLLDPTDSSRWLAGVQAYCHDGPDRARQVAAMAGYRAPTWDDHFSRVETWLEREGLWHA